MRDASRGRLGYGLALTAAVAHGCRDRQRGGGTAARHGRNVGAGSIVSGQFHREQAARQSPRCARTARSRARGGRPPSVTPCSAHGRIDVGSPIRVRDQRRTSRWKISRLCFLVAMNARLRQRRHRARPRIVVAQDLGDRASDAWSAAAPRRPDTRPPRGRATPASWSCRSAMNTSCSFSRMNSVISKSSAENGSSRNSTSGLGRQRAHDRRRLLLAAGKLVRVAIEVELDVERRDELVHPAVDLRLRLAFELAADRRCCRSCASTGTSPRGSSGTRSRSWCRASDLPSNRISPPSIGIRPAIMLISVDLPQPLGPNTDTILCLGMSRSKFSYSGQPAKYLVRPRIVMSRARRAGHERGRGYVGDQTEAFRTGASSYLPLQWTIRRSAYRNSTLSA